MKSMGWVLPTLVGVGVGAGIGWYLGSQSAAAKAAERIADVAANAMAPRPPATPNPNLGGLYGYHHGDHFGAVMLPGEGQEFRALYSQARIPGQRAMGLGAAYASIPGMAHFPGAPARAGYRNAMGY